MPFETITPPEAVESQEQNGSSAYAVSMEDWRSHKTSNPDSEQQTQDLVDQGTLPQVDFSAEDTVSSGETGYFASMDLDSDGQLSIGEAIAAFQSMDSDNDGSVSGKEFSRFLRAISDSAAANGTAPVEGDGREGDGDCHGGDSEEPGDDCGSGGGCDEGEGDCEDGGRMWMGGTPNFDESEGGGYVDGGFGNEGSGEPVQGGDYQVGGGDTPIEHEPIGGGGTMEGGMGAVTIDGDAIPPELQKYAHMEGDTLVIDAQGDQIPALDINRDNVVVKNARINGAGADAGVHITGSHVQVLNSEITGGQAGITAERASDVTVDGNNIHDFEGGHAVVFNGVDGGAISNNRVSGYYPNDAINMLGSSNLKVMYNDIDVQVDGMGAPLMVEDGGFGYNTHSHDIEVAGNRITYSGGVPPGLLGGYNLSGHDNVVNGDTSAGAWQLYHYQSDDPSFQSVWYNVYYNGQQYA